jgi:hypothetical protein
MSHLDLGERSPAGARAGRPQRPRQLDTEIVGTGLADRRVPALIAMDAGAGAFAAGPAVLPHELRLTGVGQLVDDEINEARQIIEDDVVVTEPALMAVAEDECGAVADVGAVAAVAIVGTKLDRREDHPDLERVEWLGKQAGRPVEDDLRRLAAGGAEHGGVGVEHLLGRDEGLHDEKFLYTCIGV